MEEHKGIMHMEISSLEKQFKNSSVAFLSILFLTFLAYTGSRIVRNMRTDYGHKKSDNVPVILLHIIKVVEQDMAPSFLIYGVAITFGAFFAILAILGYVLVAVMIGLFIGYWKQNYRIIQICRILNVVLTLLCFFALFADNLIFSDAASSIFWSQDGGR